MNYEKLDHRLAKKEAITSHGEAGALRVTAESLVHAAEEEKTLGNKDLELRMRARAAELFQDANNLREEGYTDREGSPS
jgi:hypothetical protein